MQFFLLGLVALLMALIVLRGFTVANPQVLASQLRAVTGAAILVAAGFLVLRGLIGYAMSLAALGSWLLWGGRGVPWGPSAGGQKSPGQTSRVATEYLEIELDHDTGEMRGRVLKGRFSERALETLSPLELSHLWQDCRFADPQSARILEAYLDRVHSSWREDMTQADGDSPGKPDEARMSREQAFDILGLGPGATEEEIRRAHRELMLKLHPDRGGSTFLAAQINEAKDILLGR